MWIINKQTAFFSTTTTIAVATCSLSPLPPPTTTSWGLQLPFNCCQPPEQWRQQCHVTMSPPDKWQWQTVMTWLINRYATPWWQWHMSLLCFTVIEVSNVPVLPLFFSHMRVSSHVTNGDVPNNNETWVNNNDTWMDDDTVACQWTCHIVQTVMMDVVVTVRTNPGEDCTSPSLFFSHLGTVERWWHVDECW